MLGLFRRKNYRNLMIEWATRIAELSSVPCVIDINDHGVFGILGGGEFEMTTHSGYICLESVTSAFGAGFHAHLIDVAIQAGDQLKLRWSSISQDSTGYWKSRDFETLARCHRQHLRESADKVLETSGQVKVNMEPRLAFDYEGEVLTPMGPRTRDHFRAVSQGIKTGEDILHWPNQGFSLVNQYRLALFNLWNDVSWMPAQEAGQSELYNSISQNLKAAMLDSRFDIPWHEWWELIHLGAEIDKETFVQINENRMTMPPPQVLIGYRRKHIKVGCGLYEMTIPGSLNGHYFKEWVLSNQEQFLGLSECTDPIERYQMAIHDLPGSFIQFDSPNFSTLFKYMHLEESDGFIVQGIVYHESKGVYLTLSGPHCKKDEMISWLKTLRRPVATCQR